MKLAGCQNMRKPNKARHLLQQNYIREFNVREDKDRKQRDRKTGLRKRYYTTKARNYKNTKQITTRILYYMSAVLVFGRNLLGTLARRLKVLITVSL